MGDIMIVEALYTTCGMTKGKYYDVIESINDINLYKIVLDDGTIAVRHKCGFKNIENLMRGRD